MRQACLAGANHSQQALRKLAVSATLPSPEKVPSIENNGPCRMVIETGAEPIASQGRNAAFPVCHASAIVLRRVQSCARDISLVNHPRCDQRRSGTKLLSFFQDLSTACQDRCSWPPIPILDLDRPCPTQRLLRHSRPLRRTQTRMTLLGSLGPPWPLPCWP